MMKLLNAVCNTHKEREEGRGKRDKKYAGKLESVLFTRVTQPPLDKYIIFQLAT
jgi:hypothetical protein